MGTLAEPASEWIELKNPGTTPISLKGWKLSSASKDIDVFLLADKFILPGGYYLLGRKFWDTADTNGPFSDITPDQLYSDGKPLSDSGDSLVLLDPSGRVRGRLDEGEEGPCQESASITTERAAKRRVHRFHEAQSFLWTRNRATFP